MADNRIFSPEACVTCGRLGDPHAEWCEEMQTYLANRHLLRTLAWYEDEEDEDAASG